MKLQDLADLAKDAEKANNKLTAKLIKTTPRDLDTTAQALHEKAFEKIDCMSCGNCCKTTSPIFYQKDIERLSKHFRIRPAAFIEKYLFFDSEDDFVLKDPAPCPFLGSDNDCMVYEHRPMACREYPHTNRKRFHQLLQLTVKNTFICPAAYEVMEGLKKKYLNPEQNNKD
ncbi:MAG TPA: YkgJ family cysteine cluster protein [Bacteroidia bacterium]|nr:YkgJ family cysteine cluster protein [Bacteroidia bacterium]